MTPVCDPRQVFAVIVGVEKSGVFADDPLVGPVRDAIEWFDWLRLRNVPSERMRLFISAKASSQPLLDEWAARQGDAVLERADESNFQNFIAGDLRDQARRGDGSLLIVVWSGHGVIDQRDGKRTRRLFYADASTRVARNLEVVSLMKALRSPEYAGFSQQIAIVDACANYSFGFAQGRRLFQPTDFGDAAGSPGIVQRVLLATAPGQVAGTLPGDTTRESVALFSHRLLAKLRALAPAQTSDWPDFAAAFRAVQQDFKDADQTPVDWCYGTPDDTLPDSGVQVLPNKAATRLVAAVAGLDDKLLKDAYYAALGRIEITDSHQNAASHGSAAMAETLSTLGHPDKTQLDPLARWAEQVRLRLDTAPGRDADRELDLRVWLRDFANAETLARYREAQQALAAVEPPPSLCFVLVSEVGAGDAPGACELHAWLFAGRKMESCALTDSQQPLRVQADGGGRAAALEEVLDLATAEANRLGIETPKFVVEFALPLERIDDDIETQPLGINTLRERPIGNRYAVVRRVADRLAALGPARARARGAAAIGIWKENANWLRERFDTHGLCIHWVDPEQIVKGLLRHQLDLKPQGSCVGLARSSPCRTLDQMLKECLFVDGLPFACWSDDAWTNADTEQLGQDLAGCVGAEALSRLYKLKQAAGFREHPSTRLRLVWDDPARNPYAHALKAESR